jgi:putative spermidine/putrescine transport system permease protein
MHQITRQPYLNQYWLSIKISLITAGLGCFLGLCIAYSVIRQGTPRFLRTVVTTFSGVAANFAGVPLAFAFIATLGTIGIVTTFLRDHLGYDLYAHGFTLFGPTGVELAYLYFQIPLMILVIAPAIDGLRAEWREAAANLGASSFQFWRYVGIPVLLPSILGAFILLFGNSFSAYATAYGIAANGISIVPITIGFYYSGNVVSDPHFAQALAFGMFLVLAGMMLLYVPLQRRSARWMR